MQILISKNDTWIAVGLIDQYISTQNKFIHANKYQYEKRAVRLLLQNLLDHLDINDTLIENSFPFYLKNTRYFICFTHSTNNIALILSKNPCSIDLENRNVPFKVAKRYFHSNELYKINQYSNDLAPILINELWRIKECIIKIKLDTLTAGMAIDLSFLIPYLADFQTQQLHIDLSALNQYHLLDIIDKHNINNLWIDRSRQISAIY